MMTNEEKFAEKLKTLAPDEELKLRLLLSTLGRSIHNSLREMGGLPLNKSWDSIPVEDQFAFTRAVTRGVEAVTDDVHKVTGSGTETVSAEDYDKLQSHVKALRARVNSLQHEISYMSGVMATLAGLGVPVPPPFGSTSDEDDAPKQSTPSEPTTTVQ